MSWNFNLVSENSKALQEEIARQEYCPPSLRDHLNRTLDEMMVKGLEDGTAFRVESNGHHDSYQSYGTFRLERVKAVR